MSDDPIIPVHHEEEDSSDDEEEVDVPPAQPALIPTDVRLIGVSLETRREKLHRLLTEKIKNLASHRGRNEAFRGVTYGFPVVRGLQVTMITKSPATITEANRDRTDSSFIIGNMRFFIRPKFDNFLEFLSQYLTNNGVVGQPTAQQVEWVFHEWVRDVLYPMYGLTPNDVPLPPRVLAA